MRKMLRIDAEGSEKRVRRYRAAVYAVCNGVTDVDRAFDSVVALMLSEKRESYLWGVMLDHAPSPLFRTFGDREIEDRARERFNALCSAYPRCGFFCVLRGRRYGGDGCFRCENGIAGVLKLLAGGSGEGFSVRLTTGDTVMRSDRIFVFRSPDGSPPNLLPGVITLSEPCGEAVMLVEDRLFASVSKTRLERSLFGGNTGNYRVCGWFPLLYEEGVPLNTFMLPVVTVSKKRAGVRIQAERVGPVTDCAMKCFFLGGAGDEHDGAGIFAELSDTSLDVQIMRLIAVLALYALSRVDTVILRDTLLDICRIIGGECKRNVYSSPGVARIALLVGASVSEALGSREGAFFGISRVLFGFAEDLRLVYEEGGGVLKTPFSPCEMVAFRSENALFDSVFCGFAAFKRVSDWFLYSLAGEKRQVASALKLLVGRGFGRYGVTADNGGAGLSENAVLLTLCAELENGFFSKALERTPELFFRYAVLCLLPKPEDSGKRASADRGRMFRSVDPNEIKMLR